MPWIEYSALGFLDQGCSQERELNKTDTIKSQIVFILLNFFA